MSFEIQPSARGALASCFDAYSPDVYGYVLARCGSPALAEDVTSEVFIDAAARFAAGRGDEVSIAWLKVVARRRLIDHWRAESTSRRRTERYVFLASAGSDVDRDRIELALDSLGERQRAALVLRYLDGFSVSEVAEALATGYRSAESLLARARRAFSVAYEEMS